jgi:hypothetical protein
MTREEAISRALELSHTGDVNVRESEGRYVNEAGEPRSYVSFYVSVDGVHVVARPSYEDALSEIAEKLPIARAERKAKLKAELGRMGE